MPSVYICILVILPFVVMSVLDLLKRRDAERHVRELQAQLAQAQGENDSLRRAAARQELREATAAPVPEIRVTASGLTAEDVQRQMNALIAEANDQARQATAELQRSVQEIGRTLRTVPTVPGGAWSSVVTRTTTTTTESPRRPTSPAPATPAPPAAAPPPAAPRTWHDRLTEDDEAV